MTEILNVASNLLSNFILCTIIFRFLDERYEKALQRYVWYIAGRVFLILALTAVNVFNNSVLNLLSWIVTIAVVAFFLYYEETEKGLKRVILAEGLLLCLAVCETLGFMLLRWIMDILELSISDPALMNSLDVAFSKVVVIFVYYLIIGRLLKKQKLAVSKEQTIVFILIFLYSLFNILLIAKQYFSKQTNYLWVVNMGGIVIGDLYLLYYIKMSEDRKNYEIQIKSLEQQARLQYEYYLTQTDKYNGTLQILHDVNKHVKMIEELYRSDKGEEATRYAKEITGMLKPLIPIKYTGNPILDILLSDKEMCMKEKGIDFRVQTENIDMRSIDPIDATTIFGNLLDNAIEAQDKVTENKFVEVKIGCFHKMLNVTIKNNSGPVAWKDGKLCSQKGPNRGLGILNVQRSIAKYDGEISFSWKDNVFTTEFFLNL